MPTTGRVLLDTNILIALLTRHHRLTLVSRDAHFRGVPDLEIVAWSA